MKKIRKCRAMCDPGQGNAYQNGFRDFIPFFPHFTSPFTHVLYILQALDL
jgi:hypothetical protein